MSGAPGQEPRARRRGGPVLRFAEAGERADDVGAHERGAPPRGAQGTRQGHRAAGPSRRMRAPNQQLRTLIKDDNDLMMIDR